MITASEYRKRLRKVITLPSGGQVEIRKLSVGDFLQVGDIPAAYRDAIRRGEKIDAETGKNNGLEQRMYRAFLINGVTSLRIVDKPIWVCGEEEISVDEIEPRDARALIDAITEFNSADTGAGESIIRFQEEPSASGDDRRDGEEIRKTAD